LIRLGLVCACSMHKVMFSAASVPCCWHPALRLSMCIQGILYS
jgi:hypothetical protein